MAEIKVFIPDREIDEAAKKQIKSLQTSLAYRDKKINQLEKDIAILKERDEFSKVLLRFIEENLPDIYNRWCDDE